MKLGSVKNKRHLYLKSRNDELPNKKKPNSTEQLFDKQSSLLAAENTLLGGFPSNAFIPHTGKAKPINLKPFDYGINLIDYTETSSKVDKPFSTHEGTPPSSPIHLSSVPGTPVYSDTQTKLGSYKKCILHGNVWTKDPFPDIQEDPSKISRFRNTPYEMYREQRQGEIFANFFNSFNPTEEVGITTRILEQSITSNFLFEQENLSAEISDTQKTAAILYIFNSLPELWKQGYILLPDAKHNNIGAKIEDGILTAYLFDWSFEHNEYEEIGHQTVRHLNFLITKNQITTNDAKTILNKLITALKTKDLDETLLNSYNTEIEDETVAPASFFKTHKEGITLQCDSYTLRQNTQFSLENRPSLLAHQKNPKRLITECLQCFDDALKIL